jgi:cell division protein FtsL
MYGVRTAVDVKLHIRERGTMSKVLTPGEQKQLQGDWIREQYKQELKIERDTWAKNKRIQRKAVREYKRSPHRAVSKHDKSNDVI